MGRSIFCHYGHKKRLGKKCVYAKIFELTTTGDNGQLVVVDGDDNNSSNNYNNYNNNNKKTKGKPGKKHWQTKTYLCMLHVFAMFFSMRLCGCFYICDILEMYLLVCQGDIHY